MARPGRRIELPAAGEVHVWHADLELPDARRRELAATLAPDERRRAERFRFAPHRQHFVAGRGLLRTILGGYLGAAPGSIRLAYAEAGKPYLAEDGAGLRFNLAHTDALMVLAVARDHEVGIDVERRHPVADMEAIAACCFSARERAVLAGLDEARRTDAFFRAWTRKEAWLKAVGCGLGLAPERVEVMTLAEGEPPRLLGLDGLTLPPRRWSLHDLCLRPGHVAALAVGGPVRSVLCRAWRPA